MSQWFLTWQTSNMTSIASKADMMNEIHANLTFAWYDEMYNVNLLFWWLGWISGASYLELIMIPWLCQRPSTHSLSFLVSSYNPLFMTHFCNSLTNPCAIHCGWTLNTPLCKFVRNCGGKTRWFLGELGIISAAFVATKTGYLSREVRPSPPIIMVTKQGIHCQTMLFFLSVFCV